MQKTEEELMRTLRQEVEGAGSQAAFARRVGISGAFLSDVLLRRRDIGPTIAKALGYRRIHVYIPLQQNGGSGK